MIDDAELTSNERAILQELYFAQQRGYEPLNANELSALTRLPLKVVKQTTQQLAKSGYIEWNQHAVH